MAVLNMDNIKSDWRSILKGRGTVLLLALALIIYALVAINSIGYHHPDEHFQIIEFAGLKAGWNSRFDIPWEYAAEIRPALQPYLAVFLIRAVGLFGSQDPFLISMILRYLTAALSIVTIISLFEAYKDDIAPRFHVVYLAISLLLWFLPSINVRFSSETWSGMFLLLSVVVAKRKKQTLSGYLWLGILIGISFEFRFQIAFAMLGLFLWLVVVRKTTVKETLVICAGGIAIILFGIGLDSLFYGHLVVTPYNYFMINVLKDVASSYGTSPWYTYLLYIFFAPTFLIGLTIFVASIAVLRYDRNNIVLWIVVPFVFFHSVIPHKELRFLFPVINLLPILFITAWQSTYTEIPKRFLKFVLKPLFVAAILVNVLGTVFMLNKPAGTGAVSLIRYIDKQYKTRDSLVIRCTKNDNPYVIGSAQGLRLNFYIARNLVFKNTTIKSLMKPNRKELYIVYYKDHHERQMLERSNFKLEESGIPLWLFDLNRFFRVFDEDYVPLLYSMSG